MFTQLAQDRWEDEVFRPGSASVVPESELGKRAMGLADSTYIMAEDKRPKRRRRRLSREKELVTEQVNLGRAFSRWRELSEIIVCLATDNELAILLLE